jgi:predicted RNA binding protein YcfA (HicA-like mRNA interferase family)
MKIVKTSKILKMLAKDGWYLVHQVGSHRQFRHPTKKREGYRKWKAER